jgi:hypothetical protein
VAELTGVPDSLRGELEEAAGKASAATAGFGAFLTGELLSGGPGTGRLRARGVRQGFA